MSERNNTARLITNNASESENNMTNTVCMPVAHNTQHASGALLWFPLYLEGEGSEFMAVYDITLQPMFH